MAYDEQLARRIRACLEFEPDVTEKKMFGGLCFLAGGNMCCGIVGEELMVRVGPGAHDATLAEPHTRPMDFTGRPMRGFLYVEPEGIRADRMLEAWVRRGLEGARSSPPKKSGARKPKAGVP
jgi:TfoX/Sxy family transcriptional regulator of competence genes